MTVELLRDIVKEQERLIDPKFGGSISIKDRMYLYNSESDVLSVINSRELGEIMKKQPREIKPGSYRTYIASAGVADIIDMFSWGGVGEASIQQGDSSLCKMRQNNVKISPCFTLSEDFTSGMVPRFNGNGELAPEKLDLILAGSLENTLVSSRTAKEYSVTSNFASDGESLRSPVLATGDLNEDEILNIQDLITKSSQKLFVESGYKPKL